MKVPVRDVALASLYHVKTSYYGATDVSPVGMAAALHVGTAINDLGIQEYMGHTPAVSEVSSAS